MTIKVYLGLNCHMANTHFFSQRASASMCGILGLAKGSSYDLLNLLFNNGRRTTWFGPILQPIKAISPKSLFPWESLPAVQFTCKELGMDFIGYEVLPFVGAIDTSTELLRLASKKPDVISVFCCGSSQVALISDSARLEIQKQGITFIAYHAGIDEFITNVVGEAAEGWYKTAYYPVPHETDLPGMRALLEAAKKYRGWKPDYVPSNYVAGWICSAVTVEAVRLAIENVGLENLRGRAVRDALMTIKDFNTGLTPPVSMDKDEFYYSKDWRIYRVEQGEQVVVQDWFKQTIEVPFGYK